MDLPIFSNGHLDPSQTELQWRKELDNRVQSSVEPGGQIRPPFRLLDYFPPASIGRSAGALQFER